MASKSGAIDSLAIVVGLAAQNLVQGASGSESSLFGPETNVEYGGQSAEHSGRRADLCCRGYLLLRISMVERQCPNEISRRRRASLRVDGIYGAALSSAVQSGGPKPAAFSRKD